MKEAAATLTKAQSQEEKSKTSTGSVNFFPCFFFFLLFLTTILPVNLLQAEHVPQPLAPLLAGQRQAEDW